MRSVIQAAVDSGRPPLELLLDEPNRKRCRLDGILIKALYLYKAYEIEGYPVWVEESPDITFKAVPRVIRSLKVVETEQEKESKKDNPEKGKRFHAEAVLRPGAKWPTRRDWEERHAKGERAPDNSQVSRRAVSEAEERAREKAEGDPEVARIIAEFEARRKQAGSMV